jgi:1-deoxy-D-xylulose-5-phosphate reductoisomerase
MKTISIVGSTGSIGRQTLAVVDSHPGLFCVVALAAGKNVALAAEQVVRHRPALVSVADAAGASELTARLRRRRVKRLPQVVWGEEGLLRVATHPRATMVVSAAVGVVGLPATYAAVNAGKQVALANKEVLVAAGEIVTRAARRAGVDLLPVDSEHNAIHQCLRAGAPQEVRGLVLTASGGPFRTTPLRQMRHVTVQQALRHPNWKMGQRITIDSATLVNKGFEVIEAHWLFAMPLEKIAVVIHPQSTIHSMVEYVDGSVIAQLGPADMRMPIQYALTYPDRVPVRGCALDWQGLQRLDFSPPEAKRFPCLELARAALRSGGAQPCAFNAADEVAVAAFLDRQLPFLGIPAVIEKTLAAMPRLRPSSISDILAADREARRLARAAVLRLTRRNFRR